MKRNPKKKAPRVLADAGASERTQHADSIGPARFAGTDNPRHLRAIAALLARPLPRENLDSVAGCANGPELVAELRRRGLEVPCKRINFVDRDGFTCQPGIYNFTAADRRKVHQWLAKRANGGADAS